MTRVNLVKVEDLADQHVLAEFRELKMVPAALRRSLKTKSVSTILSDISRTYTLNTGHVKFFYTRLQFLSKRYRHLTNELLNRNYNIEDKSGDFSPYLEGIPDEFMKLDWVPTKSEIAVNVERIVKRINERPTWYRHYGTVMQPLYFEQLYALQLRNEHTN